MSGVDPQTVADILQAALTAGGPVLLGVLAERHKGRIRCEVVDLRPGEVDIRHGNGEVRTYQLVELDEPALA